MMGRSATAEQRATSLAKWPKPRRLDANSALLAVVASKLSQDWSPEQISRWLRLEHPGDISMRLSHEAIYRSLFHNLLVLLVLQVLVVWEDLHLRFGGRRAQLFAFAPSQSELNGLFVHVTDWQC